MKITQIFAFHAALLCSAVLAASEVPANYISDADVLVFRPDGLDPASREACRTPYGKMMSRLKNYGYFARGVTADDIAKESITNVLTHQILVPEKTDVPRETFSRLLELATLGMTIDFEYEFPANCRDLAAQLRLDDVGDPYSKRDWGKGRVIIGTSMNMVRDFGAKLETFARDDSPLSYERYTRGIFTIYRISNSREKPVRSRFAFATPFKGGWVVNFKKRTKRFAKVRNRRIEAVVPANGSIDIVLTPRETKEFEGSVPEVASDAPHTKLVPLEAPEGGVDPYDGSPYHYLANGISVIDVDGDGKKELIVKWLPSNGNDNSQSGFTGKVYLEAVKLSGRRLWRIDLGRNIRGGVHYTPYLVYDFDGDGVCELICRTSDGTIDGLGNVIGDQDADWRTTPDTLCPKPPVIGKDKRGRPRYARGKEKFGPGYVVSGPEFLTVFSGKDGRALKTVPYVPERGDLNDWGDNWGNRSERFLAAAAYLDGKHPSAVFTRGYYAKTVLAAWDWDGRDLNLRWVFDSSLPGNAKFAGQGNHNLRAADVDGDGCDEIVYGQMTVDHDGTGLYSTGFGHGDAFQLTQVSPKLKGLQQWACHENCIDGAMLRDAKTGKVMFQLKQNFDCEHCLAADIDPTNEGMELWAKAVPGVYNWKGEKLDYPSDRFAQRGLIWWDGDKCREMIRGTKITKFNWETKKVDLIEDLRERESVLPTGGEVVFIGDVFGDWREEVIVRYDSDDYLRIYATNFATDVKRENLTEDRQYRLSLVNQNVGYPIAPQLSTYFGN